MKISIYQAGAGNDLHLDWDMDQHRFVLTVSRYRFKNEQGMHYSSDSLRRDLIAMKDNLVPISGKLNGNTYFFKKPSDFLELLESPEMKAYSYHFNMEDIQAWYDQHRETFTRK